MAADPSRVKSLFLAASDVARPEERAAYLDLECGNDTELRIRVESLLASHEAAAPMTPPSEVSENAGKGRFAGGFPMNADGDGESDAEIPDHEPLTFLAPSNRPDSLGRIGHYEVLKVLGRGAFGMVFRAFDDVLHRIVAVKVLSPLVAATSPARKRFLREARSSAAVRHENVVQVYEVGDQPLPYIAMEFIPGETLQQRLDRNGPLDVAELLRIGRQIAEGLAAAHAMALIHRDIKPGNILLEGAERRVKITDFGLARAADDASVTQSGLLAGTPMYMAPEQVKGQALDQRADLFSLGSVLYQMACGRPPFRAGGTFAVLKRVVSDTPRPLREIIPELPQWLCDIISKLHAKDPADRFQSARELAEVLAECEARISAGGKIAGASRILRSKATAGPSGRRKWLVAAALVLPVLFIALTEITGMTHWLRNKQPASDPRSGALGTNNSTHPAAPQPIATAPADTSPWTVLKPIEMTSEGGATLTLKSDGSILAGGNLAKVDTYTLTFHDLPAKVHSLRLEVLPDASLPHKGPGRSEEGEFSLTTFKCQFGPNGPAGEQRMLKVASAWADNHRGVDSRIGFSIDTQDETGWVSEVGKAHYAVFEFAQPIVTPEGSVLRVILEFKHDLGFTALGRFRLAAAPEKVVHEVQ